MRQLGQAKLSWVKSGLENETTENHIRAIMGTNLEPFFKKIYYKFLKKI